MIDANALPKRQEVIRAFKREGGQIAAVLPIHYPRALFRAFSILPVEVWGPPGTDSAQSGAHLQPYVCSLAHNALSFLKTGGLDVADYILVPHTCDSLQGLGSILLDFIRPKQHVFPLYLPRERRPEDRNFLIQELQHLYERLSDLTQKQPDHAALLTRIQKEEQADSLLAQLYAQRTHLSLDNLTFYRLIRTREYVPAEHFVRLAENTLKTHRVEKGLTGTPVLLSGIVPEPMEMLHSIEEAGGLVVGDDLACCGRRLYPAGTSNDPFERMAERLVGSPPDPTRGHPIQQREQHLIQLAQKTGAKGIIFYEIKFCEPELFDLPELRNRLKAAGLPSVIVEIDLNDPLSNQVVTRIGAFLEMAE